MFRMFVVSGVLGLTLSLSFPKAGLAQTGCVPGIWTEVPGVGITTGTAPAAFFDGLDLHLFVTGGADRIYTNLFHLPSNSWSGWSEVPGNFRAGGTGPAVSTVPFSNRFHLFALDAAGRIFFNAFSYVTRSWSGWQEVPGDGLGSHGLAAAWFVDNRPGGSGTFALDLFVRGLDANIWENTLSFSGTWSGWSRVPGGRITTHGPAATPTVGNITLYAREPDAGVWENIRDETTGNWRGWIARGGIVTAAPGAKSPSGPGENLLLVARGSGAGIWANFVNSSTSQWREVPGELHDTATAAPAVELDPLDYSRLLVFVSGRGDRILCTAITP